MGPRALSLRSTAIPKLRSSLLAWYDQHRRDLPWRRDRNPYHVWLSEIMLQQTRVAAVLEHYARFLKRFPTVHKLADAREASVLAVWSGLGYYHRARRMHRAAKIIARERRGAFPQTAEAWQQFPGIGRYTAAAVASIAFGEAVAVVDGNVERVLVRMFGAAAENGTAWLRAEALLDPERPGDFNQAMMELGATVCTPRAPQCELCPLQPWCEWRGESATRSQPPRKRRQLCYGLARKGGCVLLVQRKSNASLMAGMWELPLLTEKQRSHAQPLARLRHSITDTDYEVSVRAISRLPQKSIPPNARWFTLRQWQRLPLTGLARKILRRAALESAEASAESNKT